MAIGDVETTAISVTPSGAEAMLLANRFEGQRAIKVPRVKVYESMMRGGEWMPGTVIKVAIVKGEDPQKSLYLLNGQHRLRAIVDSQTTQTCVIAWIKCDSLDDVRRLYVVEDDYSKRTNRDVVTALALPEKTGISKTMLSVSMGALRFIAANFNHDAPEYWSTADSLKLQKEYQEAIFWYDTILAGIPRHIQSAMKRAAVMSVALVTIKYSDLVYNSQTDGNTVHAFWSGIADNDGLKQGDPRQKALEHLLRVRMPTRARHGTTKHESAPLHARTIANYFNAWVQGATFAAGPNGRTKVRENQPICILGSPWDGKNTDPLGFNRQ